MGSLFEGPEIRTPQVNQALSGLSGLSGLSDLGSATKGLRPINLNAGGLRGRFKGNTVSVGSTSGRRGLVNQLSRASLNQAGLLAGLRGDVTNATTGLRASRLAEIEDARKASASNLRDNLARRRILGSSFAADAETRNELEFARERERVSAESFLQEIDLKNQLINQEFDVRRNAFQTKLDELNTQVNLGSGLSTQASNILTSLAELRSHLAVQRAQVESQLAIQRARSQTDLGIAQADLDAKAQSGAGELIGKVAGIGLAPFTGGASLALAI